jgi:hypothetical protein
LGHDEACPSSLKHGVHIIARLEGAASSAPKLGPPAHTSKVLFMEPRSATLVNL